MCYFDYDDFPDKIDKLQDRLSNKVICESINVIRSSNTFNVCILYIQCIFLQLQRIQKWVRVPVNSASLQNRTAHTIAITTQTICRSTNYVITNYKYTVKPKYNVMQMSMLGLYIVYVRPLYLCRTKYQIKYQQHTIY